MFVHLLPAICASVFGVSACQDQPTVVHPPSAQADLAPPRDTTLAPSADTYIRQGSPNQNQGSELILRLQSSGKNRVMVRWDEQALVQAVAGGSVTAARLELAIADLGDNWGSAGRAIELHRLTQAWTETGATWNCAVDSLPGNSRPDCEGATAWDMDHSASYPFVAEPTATALLRNGQTGVVTFDVTADVLAWLGGQPNDGWLLKKTVEGDPGKVDFGSRESATPSRLVLSVLSDTARPPIPNHGYLPSDSDTTRTITVPGSLGMVYYRDLFHVAFADSASGATARLFLSHNAAVIVGGSTWLRDYTVRAPDVGPSWEAFDSLVARLSREPGVKYAAPITHRPGPLQDNARFPVDGPGFSRADWFGNGSGPAWSRLAVRALLAWGCETGGYTAAAPTLGVADFFFDTAHTDLAANITRFTPVVEGIHLSGDPSLSTTLFRSHGTAVAGVLAAVGDNGRGIPGMIWHAPLKLFALAARDSVPEDPSEYFADGTLRQAAEQGVRIIVSAADFSAGPGTSAGQRRDRVLEAVRRYVAAGSGNIFVFAAGDDAISGSLDAYYNGTAVASPMLVQAAIAGLLRQPRDDAERRIIVVTGTDPGNAYHAGSTFFLGGTHIAAPASSVTSLYPGDRVADYSGTSVAAPFVAGVAAMLWTMDPTLPADSIKDYIVRGAQVPRLSPTTGRLVPAPSVSDAPETVYQLDAYGALTLLSRERPGVAPVCGYGAELGVSADGSYFDHVLLRRPEALGDTIGLNLAGIGAYPNGISLAQGGRLIALSGSTDQLTDGTSFINQAGSPAAPSLAGLYRRFLESGTVDLDWNAHGNYPQAIVNVGGNSLSKDWVGIVGAGIDVSEGDVVVSPSGEYAAVYAGGTETGGCGARQRWAVVRLADGAITDLGSASHVCGAPANRVQYQGMAWSPDSRTVTALARHDQDFTCGVWVYETRVMSLTIGGFPQLDSIANAYLAAPAYSADGTLLITHQLSVTLDRCTLVARLASNIATVVSTLDLPNYAANWCLTGFGWQVQSPSNLSSRHRLASSYPPLTAPARSERVDCQPTAPPKR